MITKGVVVGRVLDVQPHPRGDRDRLALVDHGGTTAIQIVFGGHDVVAEECLVPVALPGATLPGRKKMRTRRFRGERSHGMLCSLVELGWALQCPDEVAILSEDFTPGYVLDEVSPVKLPGFVLNKPRPDDPIVWHPRVHG